MNTILEPQVTCRQVLNVPASWVTMEDMVTEKNRQEFSARLNQALDHAGVPAKGQGRQIIVAKMFGVSQKGARKWLEGEAIPTTARIPDMADQLGVFSEWLLSGKGLMRQPPKSHEVTESKPDANQYALDYDVVEDILKYLDIYRQHQRHDRIQPDEMAASIVDLYPELKSAKEQGLKDLEKRNQSIFNKVMADKSSHTSPENLSTTTKKRSSS